MQPYYCFRPYHGPGVDSAPSESSSPQTGHTTLSSTPYRQLENQSTKSALLIHCATLCSSVAAPTVRRSFFASNILWADNFISAAFPNKQLHSARAACHGTRSHLYLCCCQRSDVALSPAELYVGLQWNVVWLVGRICCEWSHCWYVQRRTARRALGSCPELWKCTRRMGNM